MILLKIYLIVAIVLAILLLIGHKNPLLSKQKENIEKFSFFIVFGYPIALYIALWSILVYTITNVISNQLVSKIVTFILALLLVLQLIISVPIDIILISYIFGLILILLLQKTVIERDMGLEMKHVHISQYIIVLFWFITIPTLLTLSDE